MPRSSSFDSIHVLCTVCIHCLCSLYLSLLKRQRKSKVNFFRSFNESSLGRVEWNLRRQVTMAAWCEWRTTSFPRGWSCKKVMRYGIWLFTFLSISHGLCYYVSLAMSGCSFFFPFPTYMGIMCIISRRRFTRQGRQGKERIWTSNLSCHGSIM